jgi:hypothetical protein
MQAASKLRRVTFPHAQQQLQALIVAVEHEVSSWPQVQLKPMFGMTAIYRNRTIFGLLPKTRSIHNGDEIWLKFPKLTRVIRKKISAESRIVPPRRPNGAPWHKLSQIKPEDYSLVIQWLGTAYEAAK